MTTEELKYTGKRLIPIGTVFTHYDHADQCLVSPGGWRVPVTAAMRDGSLTLTFIADCDREAVHRPDLCVVPDDS